MNNKMTPRLKQVLQWREQKTTLKEIGILLGVSTTRAQQLVNKVKRIQSGVHPLGVDLGVRINNQLCNAGLNSRWKVRRAFEKGKIPFGIGPKSKAKIERWIKFLPL